MQHSKIYVVDFRIGSIATVRRSVSYFRSAPNNGQHETGPVGGLLVQDRSGRWLDAPAPITGADFPRHRNYGNYGDSAFN